MDCLETVSSKDAQYGQLQLLIAELLAIASAHKSFQKVNDPTALEELLVLLRSEDPEVQVRLAAAMSKLASGNETIKKLLLKGEKNIQFDSIRDTFFSYRLLDKGASQLDKIMHLLRSDGNNNSANFTIGGKLDVYQWAIEALSFLSLQSEVKETIVNEPKALQALIAMGKSNEHSLWYGIASTFCNLCKCIQGSMHLRVFSSETDCREYSRQSVSLEKTRKCTAQISWRNRSY